MKGWVTLAAVLGATAFAASPASACSIAMPRPALPGESPEAYKTRVAEQERKQTEEWMRTRQANMLKHADLIFVGRDTAWAQRYRPSPTRRDRAGRPLPPRPVPPILIEIPAPSYYKPIDWLRGARSTTLFKVSRSNTTCGSMSIGDTTYSQPGNLYVFFARKGPLSENTLIDAIALDKIDDPALVPFVAKYRSKAQTPAR